jgi:hypothetical protein
MDYEVYGAGGADIPERDVVIRRPPLALIVTNVGTLDLNLLIIFDVLMQERNVTRAGRRLRHQLAR